MSLLFSHWSYDPLLPAVLILALGHELGLRRLNRLSSPAGASRRRQRSWWFYLGLGVLLVAVESPIDYWSERYFWVHMIQHLLLIFAAPVPIAVGAPWQPLEYVVPATVRRRVLRALLIGAWSGLPRRLLSGLRSPWLAVGGLNAALVFWHLPGPFDLAEENQAVHVWLMHGSFFVFGVLFWLGLIESRPFRPRLTPVSQMSAVFTTAVVMWILAMALSVFSNSCWYGWYLRQEPGYAAFADQQIGAGIMWVSGAVWALPAMVAATRRLMDQRGGAAKPPPGTLLAGWLGRGQGRMHARLAAQAGRPGTNRGRPGPGRCGPHQY